MSCLIKTIVFTDMHTWHLEEKVKTCNQKYLVEDDCKLLNDVLTEVMDAKQVRLGVPLVSMALLGACFGDSNEPEP
jgi:transposase